MPSGYTAPVADGTITTLKEFALRTAKAFLHHYRELSVDEPLAHVSVDSYYDDALNESISELEKWESLDGASKLAEYETARSKLFASQASINASSSLLKERYDAMLEKVLAWKPPTQEHEDGLKRLMIEQLRDSISRSCFFISTAESLFPPFEQWRDNHYDFLVARVSYRRRRLEEERERVAATNAWIDALVNSLGDE